MRRVLLVVATSVALLVLISGTGTWAYFTGGGSGAGTATTGTTVDVTLTPGTAPLALYPGGSSAVVLTVTNTNLAPVRIGSLALLTSQGTGGFAVDAAHSTCGTSSLSFTTQTNGTTGWTVPAKTGTTNGTLSITLAGALAMSTDAANACQGATFTVYLSAGA